MSWGPEHQPLPRYRRRRYGWRYLLSLVMAWFLLGAATYQIPVVSVIVSWGGLLIVLGYAGYLITKSNLRLHLPGHRSQVGKDPLAVLRALPAGVHLGLARDGSRRRSPTEHAVLVLGPPRSGKTSGVIIPTLLGHAGPAVCTSTKPDVMRATHRTRAQSGQVWQFDPTATTPPADGVQVLRWSPVPASMDWDGALLMARAMVTGAHVGTGTTDHTHWTRRAQALLAPLLHAAAMSGKGIADVVDWINRHEVDEPGALLTEHDGSRLASGQLVGLGKTEARERSSIFSAAADAIDAYSSQAALDAATDPNFFAGRFVTGQDTIYIHAPAENQQLAAPLVCGLLAEIRRATYTHHRDATLRAPVLFALDEVANVAPITELPQLASEGASQGVLLLAALQDLSQARARWGTQADGFLTLFGTKLLLPGIADQKTLEAVSTMLGEYDRRVVSHNSPNIHPLARVLGGPGAQAHSTTTTSTQRQRRVSPGDVARIPHGKALHLHTVWYELITLTPAHQAEPWRTLTNATPSQSPPASR